jgi:hypothetical protein
MFGLVCYFSPGCPKNQHFDSLVQTSYKPGVFKKIALLRIDQNLPSKDIDVIAGLNLLRLRFDRDENDRLRLLHDSGCQQSDDQKRSGTKFDLRTKRRTRHDNWNDIHNRLQ